jgi:DDE superfamily endonuclease
MHNLPAAMERVLLHFAPIFSARVWAQARALLVGAILAPGHRTVTQALRMLGLAQGHHFQNYHRVLSRAKWSCHAAGRVLLLLLVHAFAPAGPLVVGLDDTIERRWGRKIKARGIYRDPVRSSHGHIVKASGLRWLSLMLLTPIPWAGRVWALPFLTVLVPSERYAKRWGKRHKTLLDWARQLIVQLKRWLPERELIVVGDSSFAALKWLAQVQRCATAITRLRLDATLYAPAAPRKPNTLGRPRKKGARLPTLSNVLADAATCWRRIRVSQWYGRTAQEVEIATGTAVWYHAGAPIVPLRWVLVRDAQGELDPKAFLCTDRDLDPVAILAYFVRRWQIEVTFEEVRRHLGVETQRQWSDRAIARTTPVLLGLFSLVTLVAHHLQAQGALLIRQAAWYQKSDATFSDALAAVRRELWRRQAFSTSGIKADTLKIPQTTWIRLTDTLAYAA